MSITRKLAGKIMNYDDDAQSIGSKLRAKRIKPLLSMIDAVHENCGRVNIPDLGGRKSYWKILPEEVFEQKNVYVTLLNMPGSDNPEAGKKDLPMLRAMLVIYQNTPTTRLTLFTPTAL